MNRPARFLGRGKIVIGLSKINGRSVPVPLSGSPSILSFLHIQIQLGARGASVRVLEIG